MTLILGYLGIHVLSREIVFVDPSVSDYEGLIAGLDLDPIEDIVFSLGTVNIPGVGNQTLTFPLSDAVRQTADKIIIGSYGNDRDLTLKMSEVTILADGTRS